MSHLLAPPRFTNVSNDTSLREGHDLQLFCDAYGRPTPNITWVRITSSGSESDVLHRDTIWDFKDISRTEAGTYRCTAYNGVGNPVNHTLRVNVTCECHNISTYMYVLRLLIFKWIKKLSGSVLLLLSTVTPEITLQKTFHLLRLTSSFLFSNN